MKRLHIGLLMAMWAVLLSALPGCTVPGENISRKGVVTVQRVPSAKVDILWANVYQVEDAMVVRGVVRRRERSSYPLLVHIDAAVWSRDGEILKEEMGQDVRVPRRLAGKGLNYNDFEICLPITPPTGGTVKLVCHAGSRAIHSADGFHPEGEL